MNTNTNEMMNKLKNNIDKLFENKLFITIFVIFVSVFASHFAPKLPKKILQLFNSNIFKILFMTFIAYSATKNIGIALVSSILLVILMQSLRSLEMKNKITDKILETTQITSESRIKLINQMIENPNIETKQKIILLNNVMNSVASDKHKFNTALLLINSKPSTFSKVIDKLYSPETKIKPKNIINMSHKLLSGKYISKKYIPKIIVYILKLPIEENKKKEMINQVLIKNPNLKVKIINKINNSTISLTLKNEFMNILNNY